MEKKNINEVIANLSVEHLAGMIDHTFLKPFGTAENIEKLCAEARQYKFAMVAINPAEVETCVKLLEGSGVRVGAAIGFPLGQNTVECKAFETRDAIAKGATEIDTVINVRALQKGQTDIVKKEIEEMVAICRPAGVICKVILETCYLSDAEKETVCRIAKEAGVDVIYKAGGAQAVAAMAYGTKSIPKVDKICGPGNIYVALAKKAVFGYVSIDSVAGPSEILVIADETANPRYVAADLLSQAEHDEMASAILVTTSEDLAHKVSAEVDKFVAELSRKEIIQKSLDNYGYILVAKDIDEAVDVANEIASEHMEIVTKNPFDVMTKVKNAGAIFLGEYSSEPLGDYFAGPNHVLPTNGTAKFFSPLSVDDFIKKSSIISYSRNALEAIHTDIEKFATAEHLTAHANSIKVRFEN